MTQTITIKGTATNPLFRASDIGSILEISNVRQTIKDFDNTEKVAVSITDSIGRDQNVSFLTELGLYQLLFISRKPIAKIFKKWVCEVIKEIRLNGVYDLQKQLEKQQSEMQLLEENKNKEMEEKVIQEKELEREKILFKEYDNVGNMIYIIKVKNNNDGSYIVKLGHSTKGIKERYNECKLKHKNILLLNCFAVDKSHSFEQFLHSHKDIQTTNVKKLPGHESEKELFLIGTTLTYKMLLKIIEDNINNYNYRVSELLLENQLLKEKLNSTQYITQSIDNQLILEVIQTNKILLNKVSSLEQTNKEILNKLNSQETKIVNGFNQQMPHLGPRLQKINPETLQLVKVYESVTEAMNENKNIKRPSINKAIQENTIYCGFRWLLVERNLDSNMIHNIEPTKTTRSQNLGYIAKLNIDKSEIINVYLDRKTAADFNGYQSSSALDTPVKNNTLTNGNYYMLYDNCEEKIIHKFEETNGNPLLYKNGIGQFDFDNNLVKEFSCKYDVIRELKMSDKTLTKALENNIPYNNRYYKVLGSKLKCL